MKLYIQAINDAGEIEGVYDLLVTCEDCMYFWSHDRYKQQPHSCLHPDGPINPVPDGFCNYGKEKVHHE